LFLLTPLTHLKRDWINSGTIKILFMISEHSCREPEVGVKFCMINFSKLVYCKVFLWCGHRGFKPALVNSVYVYVCKRRNSRLVYQGGSDDQHMLSWLNHAELSSQILYFCCLSIWYICLLGLVGRINGAAGTKRLYMPNNTVSVVDDCGLTFF